MERNREAVLLSMNDEDLEAAGVDPATVSNAQFERIAELFRERINESFMLMLAVAIAEEAEERNENAQ